MDRTTTNPPPSDWSAKYGERHTLRRIADFPQGIIGPKKVRVYQRVDHYILQWWDPAARKSLSDRINGDLVAAISRAREIDQKLEHFRSGGTGRARLRQEMLADEYLNDLRRRCNGGEVSPRTVERYESAIQHFLAFATDSNVESRYRWATNVDRRFSQEFQAFLQDRQVPPNGHPNTARRPLKSQSYVLDVVRGMYAWAADPQRGNLMPDGFRNPFSGTKSREARRRPDLFSETDVTIAMATQFLASCDAFQLRLFAPMILYGLRASEPCQVFRDDMTQDWIHVLGRPEMGYDTKGLCDKRLPLVAPLEQLLCDFGGSPGSILLFPRRTIWDAQEKPQLAVSSVDDLILEYQRRVRKLPHADAVARDKVRVKLLKDAGGMTYDQIQGEFLRLAKQLNWPKKSTLKDFRHLFSTSLENAGVPLFYRRYLMGQSPGQTPIVTYTHINELRQQYQLAVDRSFSPLLDAIMQRMEELKSQFSSNNESPD